MYSNRYNLTTCALKKQTKTMFGTILSLDQVILSILSSAVSDHCALFCTSSSLVHYYTRTAFSSWVQDKLKFQLCYRSTKTFQIRLLQRALKSLFNVISCVQLFFFPKSNVKLQCPCTRLPRTNASLLCKESNLSFEGSSIHSTMQNLHKH